MSIGNRNASSSKPKTGQKPAGGSGRQGDMTRTGPSGDPTGAPFGDDQRQEQGGQAGNDAGRQGSGTPQDRERGGSSGQR